MFNFFKSIWLKLKLVFGSKYPQKTIAPSIVSPKKTKREKGGDDYATLYYLKDLLSHLDNYFQHIKFLRSFSEDDYELYRNTGALVLNSDALLLNEESLKAEWLHSKPSFGAIHFLSDKESKDGRVSPYLMYYKKMKSPYFVEATNGEVYEMTIIFCDKKKKFKICGGSCHLSINDAGEVRLLRESFMVEQPVGRYHRKENIARKVFGFPAFVKMLAAEHKYDFKEYAAFLFRLIANNHALSQGGFQIYVERGNKIANFSIDKKRSPYFFKDREVVVNDNGKTRRIFHLVRSHERTTSKGTTIVSMHGRGLKKFFWNGYRVTIKNPLKDRKLFNFGAEMHYVEDEQENSGMLTISEVSQSIRKVIQS